MPQIQPSEVQTFASIKASVSAALVAQLLTE